MQALSPVYFDVQTGFDDEALRRQVDRNMRGRRSIALYANGPSAKYAPKHYPCAVVNGALKLFQVSRPDFWIACDPQPLAADFLKTAIRADVSLVASKCHPDVWAALADETTIMWHVGDASTAHLDVPKIPSAVSVTICALGLLYQMGYSDIDVYGWDCCYLDGRDHAVAQDHDKSKDRRVTVGAEVFDTTTTWGCEVEDAINYLEQYPGLRLAIHGPGMVGAIMRHKRVPNLRVQ